MKITVSCSVPSCSLWLKEIHDSEHTFVIKDLLTNFSLKPVSVVFLIRGFYRRVPSPSGKIALARDTCM